MKNAGRFLLASAIGLSLALSGCATNTAASDINVCDKVTALNKQGAEAIASNDRSRLEDTLAEYKRLGEATPTALGRSIVKAYSSINNYMQNHTAQNPADISGPESPAALCALLGVNVLPG